MQVSRVALPWIDLIRSFPYQQNKHFPVCFFVSLFFSIKIQILPPAISCLMGMLTRWGKEFEIAAVRVIGHLLSPHWRGWFRFKTTQQGTVAVMDHFAAFLQVSQGLLALASACFALAFACDFLDDLLRCCRMRSTHDFFVS